MADVIVGVAQLSTLGHIRTMTTEQVITEARARIIWGESALLVREFLVSNGLSATDADSKIEGFCAERCLEIRRDGRRQTFIGATLIFLAGIMFYPCYSYFDSSTYLGGVRIIAVFAIVGLFGLWKLTKGVIYLARPQSVHKSV